MWTKNGNVVNDSFSQAGGDLIIQRASEGFFQCVATNFLGSAISDIAHVRISCKTTFFYVVMGYIFSAISDQNEFKGVSRDKVVINAILGSFLILYCEIPYGNPKPQSYWVIRKRHSLQILDESERITTDFEGF